MQLFVTLGDILGIAMFAIFAFIALISLASLAWKQWRCKHDGSFGETQACDAICHKCGKNLGFIGSWRDTQKKG